VVSWLGIRPVKEKLAPSNSDMNHSISYHRPGVHNPAYISCCCPRRNRGCQLHSETVLTQLPCTPQAFGGFRNVSKEYDTTFYAQPGDHDRRPHSFQARFCCLAHAAAVPFGRGTVLLVIAAHALLSVATACAM
jgi:hypothetical protein